MCRGHLWGRECSNYEIIQPGRNFHFSVTIEQAIHISPLLKIYNVLKSLTYEGLSNDSRGLLRTILHWEAALSRCCDVESKFCYYAVLESRKCFKFSQAFELFEPFYYYNCDSTFAMCIEPEGFYYRVAIDWRKHAYMQIHYPNLKTEIQNFIYIRNSSSSNCIMTKLLLYCLRDPER